VGKPADKMLVYLIDDKGKAVSYTHTDTDGKFDFGKVPVGNYKVWGEMAGKQTIPALANINNIVNKVSGINIIIGKIQLVHLLINNLKLRKQQHSMFIQTQLME